MKEMKRTKCWVLVVAVALGVPPAFAGESKLLFFADLSAVADALVSHGDSV